MIEKILKLEKYFENLTTFKNRFRKFGKIHVLDMDV